MATEFTHSLRSEELELAIPHLPPHGHVLELGAGDGWQARALANRGFTLAAVDIAPAPADGAHFPVRRYDGRSLPFSDNSFDAVYSSNVLEHVVEFAVIQRELARVLRPGGVAVHCVPSATWRFWTTAGHPLDAARWLLRLRRARPNGRSPGAGAAHARGATSGGDLAKLLRRGLVPPRHGESGSLLSEHWLFSRRGWNRRFRETGWDVTLVRRTGLFYSGNELFGLRLGNPLRRRLAAVLGSSTWIYVLRSTGPTTSPGCSGPAANGRGSQQ